jgi:hypothetical protein
MALSREQKIEKARELREQGLNNSQIAAALGVKARKTVWGWLNPEANRKLRRQDNERRREAQRAWLNSHRAACEECGTALQAGSTTPSVKGKTGLCKKCLGRLKAERNKPQRLQARGLRAGGWTAVEIGEQLGVSAATVAKWCAVPRSMRSGLGPKRPKTARLRSWDLPVDCPGCGGPMHKQSSHCSNCYSANRLEATEQRARVIEQRWSEDKTLAEIAHEFGWTTNRAGGEIHRLRAKGYSLPYRRAVYPTGKPRFPEQVAA